MGASVTQRDKDKLHYAIYKIRNIRNGEYHIQMTKRKKRDKKETEGKIIKNQGKN